MKLRLTHVQIIVAGYLSIVLLGTLLLSLPISSANGASAPFLTALFTAVSSSCVTGLVLRDTATGWSGPVMRSAAGAHWQPTGSAARPDCSDLRKFKKQKQRPRGR